MINLSNNNAEYCPKCERCFYQKPKPPRRYDGLPPKEIIPTETGDVVWVCECGVRGISSNRDWAYSDVNQHRKLQHNNSAEKDCQIGNEQRTNQ